MGKALAVSEGIPAELIGIMDAVDAERQEKAARVTQEEKVRNAVSALLEKLGGLQVQDDALTFEGERFVLPAQYEGNIGKAIDFLRNQQQQSEQEFEYNQTFLYRPYDVAYAFDRVMKMLFGTTGHGQTIHTMFGKILPTFVSVEKAPGEKIQVPWGQVTFPPYNATFQIGYTGHREFGTVGHLSVEAPRKWRRHIQAMFGLIEQALKEDSLYRGKAITGEEHPTLINPFSVDPDRIVYSADVIAALEAELWVLLTHTEDMRRLGVPLKRRVLLEGPYGTGKTLAGMWTAQKAVTHGWTFIQCRPGKDKPEEVLRTAQLYAPAVVLIEDVEVIAGNQHSAADLSRLLEMLDGMGNKGKEIVALFTTNHMSKIQKGALRPGRIDSIISVTKLDEAAFRKLVNVTLPPGLLAEDIDWAAVAEAYDGYLPAFAVEAVQRATRYTFARTGEVTTVTTEDLVHAAKSLRPQWTLMQDAPEGAAKRTIEQELRSIVDGSLGRTHLPGYHEPFEVKPVDALNGNGKH